jgi:hypothetical protein
MGDIPLAVLLLGNGRGEEAKLESDTLPELQMRVRKKYTKKRKSMTNVNTKRCMKMYFCVSHNKKRKNRPITGRHLQQKALHFHTQFSEEESEI